MSSIVQKLHLKEVLHDSAVFTTRVKGADYQQLEHPETSEWEDVEIALTHWKQLGEPTVIEVTIRAVDNDG